MKKFSTNEKGIKKVVDIIVSQIEQNKEKYQIKENEIGKLSSIFLAGAPGSGKTEFILSILKNSRFFFIDVDRYREYFYGYKGANSENYQHAISGVINGVTKYCFKHDIRFILDGTFKSLVHVKRNIQKCKRKKRKIDIYFIFQDPYVSYYFTFLRKIKNERNIPIIGFIDCFYESIRNIFLIKGKDKNINLYICEKMNFTERVILRADYKIRPEFKDLKTFCKFYNIGYNSDVFTNREMLTGGIHQFDEFLKKFTFIVRIHMQCINIKRKLLGQKKEK